MRKLDLHNNLRPTFIVNSAFNTTWIDKMTLYGIQIRFDVLVHRVASSGAMAH
jgi:hypothetical protein